MKYIINKFSLFLAKRFESSYSQGKSSQTFWLNRYRSVRRMLPLMSDGNRWGNHTYSNKNPFYATQGY